MNKWPRLLCSKEAPEGVLCTSDAHRAMLGPTWFEMPNPGALPDPIQAMIEKDQAAILPMASHDSKKPRKAKA